ncbi:hypothetical protein SODALDRAFT_165436 [Sodiomyces alkalinus F11]|uniref:Uncharacterized protein n=1 Tax=Sodiomyces alkalinus (strain CBS 110278 / VKM F-3762 / F11) TaxID=1314773 RepID=A0A3N2PVP1_SODAK|nr:hypothetical protein SODALDRAFT_165436 [Sodiomyces alkalinus F11]ROT38573.1 hypothetical protein SODALDRAFT_165436 [Sodiomyces alkalinus F11]
MSGYQAFIQITPPASSLITTSLWLLQCPMEAHSQGLRSFRLQDHLDDLGVAEFVFLRSRQDLTVSGVVDLEWPFIGPAQLSGRPSLWWLLMERLINSAWDWMTVNHAQSLTVTSNAYAFPSTFWRKRPKSRGYEVKELPRLARWSEHSGVIWIHLPVTVNRF